MAGKESVVMHLIWEWWGAMYGNVFAISFWTVVMFIWHHFSLKRHITAEHERSRVHFERLNGSSGMVVSGGDV